MIPGTAVLLVDDNADLVDTCEMMLVERGFRVLKTGNGREAVELCERNQSGVALAIVDLKLPGLDGPATIEALIGRSPGIKVVSVSGETLSPYFGRLASLGVRHFLPKPFGVDDLMETIRDLSIPS
jgi:two-component system, cell cycle sensor histidine kinase and response regulator CckA